MTETTDTETDEETEEETEEAEPEQEATETAETTEETDSTEEATEDEDEDGNPGREAAKYRRRLRETETERDQLATALDAARRQIVESRADLHKPEGIWLTGIEPADLFGDDGALDAVKLAEAVTRARDELGLAQSRRGIVPREGFTTNPPAAGTRFEDAFRP